MSKMIRIKLFFVCHAVLLIAGCAHMNPGSVVKKGESTKVGIGLTTLTANDGKYDSPFLTTYPEYVTLVDINFTDPAPALTSEKDINPITNLSGSSTIDNNNILNTGASDER